MKRFLPEKAALARCEFAFALIVVPWATHRLGHSLGLPADGILFCFFSGRGNCDCDAITFARYYQGAAIWKSVPDISDHRQHRWDLAKNAMKHADSIREILW